MSRLKETKDAFRDAIYALTSGEDLPSETEEATTDEGSDTGAPAEESTPEEESPEVESPTEADGEQPGTEGDSAATETETEAAEGTGSDEDTSVEPTTDDGSQTVDLDGEIVTLDQVREWRQDGLRQSDYTRKTQEAAATRKSAEEEKALLQEIVKDPSMKQFISAHPEVIPGLLENAEHTRNLLGNAEEIQGMWDDYELIADNPRLAERFHGQPEEVSATLEEQREAENMQAVGNYIDQKIAEISKGFEGVDAADVAQYVLQLGRVPVGENVDPQEVKDGFGRLFTLMFVQDESGNYDLDTTLIQNRFEQLSTAASVASATEGSAADEHNAQVDAKLKDTAPPASGGGDAPAPTAEKLKPAASLDEVIHELRGY